MYKVLLVDDELFILEGLESILNWKDYNLEVVGKASNGFDAFLMLENTTVDIIITDITMPKMNGLELISQAKALNPDIKFIILSGYDDFNYIKEGMKLGIENYLLKPINIDELISTLTSTVEKIESSLNSEIYLKNNLNILRDNVLYRWVTNNIDSTELIERCELVNIDISFKYYTVSTIKLFFPFDENDTTHNNEKAKIISDAYKLSSKVLSNSAHFIIFCDLDGNILLIHSYNSLEESTTCLNPLLKELQDKIKNHLNLDVFITVGSVENSYTNLYKSYHNSKKIQDYLLIIPKDRIIRYDEVQRVYDKKRNETLNLEHFSKLLLAKDKKSTFAFIDSAFEQIQSYQNVTPSDIQNYAIDMILTINKHYKELHLDNEFLNNDYTSLFYDLLKLNSIEKLKDHIKNESYKLITNFSNEDTKMSPIIKQILNYINTDYSKDLSLKTLSNKYNINSTYLGQLFQKETNELFSDYVNKIRIEKAKELLLNTNLKTSEISNMVGYSDTNYFYKKFKLYCGISPTELRNRRNY